jgi:hypothetical protein
MSHQASLPSYAPLSRLVVSLYRRLKTLGFIVSLYRYFISQVSQSFVRYLQENANDLRIELAS